MSEKTRKRKLAENLKSQYRRKLSKTEKARSSVKIRRKGKAESGGAENNGSGENLAI